MIQHLLDSDHLTLFGNNDPAVCRRVAAALQAGTVAVPVVVAEEALRGRLAAVRQAPTDTLLLVRYAQLRDTIGLLCAVPLVPYDAAAEADFQLLRPLKLRIGTRDQRIAATARARGLTLATRNHRDFAQVPGLAVVDWSV